MIDTLLMPFQFGFMQNAFLVALLLAPATAMLSCFLVLKGWSLMGDAVSHAVLPGIVLAYIAGIPLIIGAFCAGMVCALATGYLKDNSRVKQDTIMGVVFSGMSPDGELPEIIELPDHPWFIGVQFHPEYKSTVDNPHPLFNHFVKAAIKERELVG